jgi:hypothetical protein
LSTVIINGYDPHSITASEQNVKRFKAWESFELDGQGFMHEEDGEMIVHCAFIDADREARVGTVQNARGSIPATKSEMP